MATRSRLGNPDTCHFPCRRYYTDAASAAAVAAAADAPACSAPVGTAGRRRTGVPGPCHCRTWRLVGIAGRAAEQTDGVAAAAAAADSQTHHGQRRRRRRHHRLHTSAALLGRDSPGRAGARLVGMS